MLDTSHEGRFGPRFIGLRSIGQGGEGVIFAAHDTQLDLPVALKMLSRRAPAELSYLKHEFRVLAAFEHPNLVRLHDLFVDGTNGWFSMELVDGVDFVTAHADARRAGPVALQRRFVGLAPGLVDSLGTVHAAGFLHADLKPANVLVEPDGRVVLLDFGMSRRIDLDDRLADTAGVAGTLAYLPPEAVDDPRPTAAWDIYALGLLFFEALTGLLPFADDFSRALSAKRRGLPDAGRHALSAVSPQLAGTIGDMLQGRAEARPPLTEVLDRLGVPPPRSDPPRPAASRLVGRDEPTAALLRWSDARGFSTCVLRGASGVGKTSLARSLVRELRARGELVLFARCHPCESVPFNGLDGILDDLARCASRDEVTRDPHLLGSLAAVFPVFASLVDAMSDAPHTEDAGETLGRAVEALRALLALLARRHRLVLWIDDVQWADSETRRALRSWGESSEPPGVRLLLTSRADAPEGVRADLTLELSPLSEQHAIAFVREIAPGLPDPEILALHAEAAGNPYILQRLARVFTTDLARPVPSLAGTLSESLADLPEDGETAALLLALAARPLDLDVLAASGVRRWVPRELERRGIVVRSADGRLRFELQHDRLAAALLARAADERKSRGHASLAAVLIERNNAEDTPHIATHLHASAHPDAAPWASRAAERFSAAYALDSAAEWHRRALAWTTPGDPATPPRRLALARALVAAGRAAEAGDTFVACAAEATSDARLHLQQAAESFLGAGITEQGMAVLRPLLASRRIAWPTTPPAAAAGILVRLGRIALRSLLPAARRGSPQQTFDLDLCWAAAKGLLGTDAVRGAFYVLEGLDRADAQADARRHARHLASVAAIVLAPLGGRMAALGRRWIDRAAATAASARDPYLVGFTLVCAGQLAVIDGRWSEARNALASGVELLRGDGVHAHWEQHIGLMGLLRALQELRLFAELRAEATALRLRAEALGDLYAEVTGRLYEAIGQLSLRQTTPARANVARALARWGTREALDIQQLYAEHILTICDVADGDAPGAWRRLTAAWPRWQRSQLLRIPVARIDCLALRARVALCAAHSDPASRPTLLNACRADARRLRREPRPDARALADILLTQLDAPNIPLAEIFPTHIPDEGGPPHA